jgi:hypothetical protein
MSTIIVTPDLMTQLQGMRQPLELRDQHGILLGYFQPTSSAERYDEMLKTCPDPIDPTDESATDVLDQSTEELLEELQRKWPIA